MIIHVPNAVPSLDFKVVLDGVAYQVALTWNMRSGWYLGLTAVDDTVITRPRRVLPGWPILVGITTVPRPPGVLMVISTNGSALGLKSFGLTHFLTYFTEAELDG